MRNPILIKVGAFLQPYHLPLGPLRIRSSHTLLKNYINIGKTVSSFGCHRILTYFSQRFDLDQFDFSSQLEWDRFYEMSNNDTNAIMYDEFYEWHKSLCNERIIDQIPLTASSVVVVGCGTSRLPEQLLRDRYLRGIIDMKVACLDYSQVCIDTMNQYYFGAPSTTNSDDDNIFKNLLYAHGDATQMDKVLRKENLIDQVDAILDKGLLDAILCGEGWDTNVERLLNGASQLLSKNGVYILISYRLIPSVKEVLVEIGNNVGIQWDFNITTLSSQSISYSYGYKTHE